MRLSKILKEIKAGSMFLREALVFMVGIFKFVFCIEITSSYFSGKVGRLSSNLNETYISVGSTISCAKKCMRSQCCFSYSYSKNTEECDIHFVVPKEVLPTDVDSQADWMNFGRGRYYGLPRDCYDLHTWGCPDDVYTVYPASTTPFKVYCDMTGGGWTFIQRRFNGSIPFHSKLWSDYKVGFGIASKTGEHWIGNDNIHSLTTQRGSGMEVEFELKHPSGGWYYANYKNFYIENEANWYRLWIGDYSGTAGDAIHTPDYYPAKKDLNGRYFSTSDEDHDATNTDNCADSYKAGWWYNKCSASWLNAVYSSDGMFQPVSTHPDYRGLYWGKLSLDIKYNGTYASIMETIIKIKPMDVE
ncbi:unnamed protein product [Owenia fusiformis]|uniref:Uncharacterized protein n=1 Tax=Owenia fusiformis TaxID=6347 RepID=A0A8J1U6I1_OWEFU|nr:unnamed protein product [Owenia fusiformis]